MAKKRKSMIKTEFQKQYSHTWRVFERLVNDFEGSAWLSTGRGTITPARLSFHILKAVKYYLKDQSKINFASGKPFNIDSETALEESLPSQNDIAISIREFRKKTEMWLDELEFDADNKSFQWAGETKLGLAIFLLRHTLFHIGELSSLLNESKNGNVEDHYVNAI